MDPPTSLRGMLEGLTAVQEELGLTVLLPLHPRIRKRAEEFGLTPLLERLRTCVPVGYLEVMSLAVWPALSSAIPAACRRQPITRASAVRS